MQHSVAFEVLELGHVRKVSSTMLMIDCQEEDIPTELNFKVDGPQCGIIEQVLRRRSTKLLMYLRFENLERVHLIHHPLPRSTPLWLVEGEEHSFKIWWADMQMTSMQEDGFGLANLRVGMDSWDPDSPLQINGRNGKLLQEAAAIVSHRPAGPVVTAEAFTTFGLHRSYMRKQGKYYYEIKLIEVEPGCIQAGVLTERFSAKGSSNEGVGDDEHGWGGDGLRNIFWHDGRHQFEQDWSAGDIIGIAADLDAGKMLFTVNGQDTTERSFDHGTFGVFPAVSTTKMKFSVYFGHSTCQHKPAGYESWAEVEVFHFPPENDTKSMVDFCEVQIRQNKLHALDLKITVAGDGDDSGLLLRASI